MVYRIRVLSFTRSALISDRWLALGFNITQNSFPKRSDFFPPSDESTPDTRQSRKQTFFSVAVLTTVKRDLFKTRYMLLRGGKGELRAVLRGSMSDGCQPPPHFLICVLPLAHANFSSGYFLHRTSERQIHMSVLCICVAGACWR